MESLVISLNSLSLQPKMYGDSLKEFLGMY